MYAEHSLVVLSNALPDEGLHAGDVGAVVHVYGSGSAYEVEFVDGDGSTVAVKTLEPQQLRAMAAGELLHVRQR